jgi:hypothetical protein
MEYYKFIAKLSRSSFGLMERIQNFSNSVLTGFWLGVLGEKSLSYSDEIFYNNVKHYTDDKYNLKGLYNWEKPIIDKHFSNAKTILLIAAGGGREVLALSKMGFVVDSYECNTKFIEYGNSLLQKNNIDARIKFLKRNSVPEEIKKYDGIIIGWGAYSHIPGNKKRLLFLSGLYPFLNKDAPLMISFLWSEQRTKKDKIIKSVANFFEIFSKKDKTELGDKLLSDYIHYFTDEEIKNELIQSNYKILDYYTTEYGCVIAGI